MYDFIVIGGGASGLFFGASLELHKNRGLIIEAAGNPGQKLLASGGGRCNFTHDGSIKHFPEHYISSNSNAPGFVRSALYKFNNIDTIKFFKELGIPSYSQDDGRIFPSTNSSLDIRNALIDKCKSNGWKFSTNSTVLAVDNIEDFWTITTNCGKQYAASKVIVATGGPAWKTLGRGDGMLRLLQKLGLHITRPIPALTQINIDNFDLGNLSGISFDNVKFRLLNKVSDKLLYKKMGALLITENGFSGPLAINASTIINKMKYDSEENFVIEFVLPGASMLTNISFDGINTHLLNSLRKISNLPERYIKHFTGAFSNEKASSVPVKIIRNIINQMYTLRYEGKNIVFPTFDTARSSIGGVSLDEVNKKSFRCNSPEGLYIIGEALDITADTGGYNLQFSWSSAHAAATDLIAAL